MYEAENKTKTQDEELVDILLDFIIIAASLAKKINQSVKQKQIEGGGKNHGQNERIGCGTMKGVSMMDNEYFQALMGYKTLMAQAKIMLTKGLISADEYRAIETKISGIFGINSDSLFRENDWINTRFRGNIVPTKEVL